MKSIFISSTFRDMQAERDVLHQQVFPALRKRLAAYGEDVQELDLRWGVDTSRMSEEQSGEFVIESCIDSIDRCKPYMVVLLGSRYGWVPTQETIEATADERIHRWYESGSSITHLEIQYGALRSEIEPDRCIFCFRNEDFPDRIPADQRSVYTSESPAHARKLRELKEQIRSRDNARVLEYEASWDEMQQAPGGLDEFARQLTEALWQILSADLDPSGIASCPEAQIFLDAQLTAQQYLSSYVSRRLDRDEGPHALMGQRAYWFSGEGGSGKSAMMAKIAHNGRRTGTNVFLYYGGNAGCRSTNTLAKTLIWWLNNMIGGKQTPSDYLVVNKMTLESLILMQRKWHPDLEFAILVDGIDQMEEDTREFLCWLSRVLIPENQDYKVRRWHGLAASSTSDYAEKWKDELIDCFNMRKLEPLNNSELDTIAQSHSARRGKKLDEQVMRRIRAKEKSSNPYYLSLLLQKLFMMNLADFRQAEALAPGMAGLSQFMCLEMDAMPDTVEEMTIALLQEACDKLSIWVRDYGENTAEPMAVLALLAASREGLTIEQLTRALEIQGLNFPTMFLERLFSYLYDSFSESDKGVWDFRHRLLRESLIRYIGPERYRKNCAVLLALNAGKDDAETPFYYAWQAGDVQMGLQILRDKKQNLEDFGKLFGQLQQSESGVEYLTALARHGDSQIACTLLEWMQINIDRTLRCQDETEAILSAAAPTGESTLLHCFRHCLMQQKIRFWDLDGTAFREGWKQLLDIYAQFDNTRNIDSSLYGLCQDVLGQKRYWDLWGDALSFLENYQPSDYFKDKVEIDRTVARLLVQFKTFAEAKDRAQEGHTLIAIRDYLLARMDNVLTRRKYLVLAAQLALEKKCNSDVVDLLKDLLQTAEGQYNSTQGAMDALYLITATSCVAGALKAETAAVYYQKARNYCRRAMKDFSGTYFRYLNCRAGIGLWQAQKKTGKESDIRESHKTLEALIPELDALVETIGADRMDVETLQEFLDQRYQRVYLRRTTTYLADKDSGKTSMDGFLKMLQGNYEDVSMPESKVKPCRFFDEQEADFAYLNAHYPALEPRCSTYSVYVDMAYAKLEEMRFYDACHQESKMIAAANRVLSMATFMSERKAAYMRWYAVAFRLELAELLHRYYYMKSAADLTDTVFKMLQDVDTKWIVDTKRVDEYYRRIVRCYLMLARMKMRSEDQLQDAVGYIVCAFEKLDGKDGKPGMSKSCDDLRCEGWILFGQILNKMGKDGSDVMNRADKYWPEEEVRKVLNRGGSDKLVRLIRYCQSLSIRAKKLDDHKLMDQATEYLCRIARDHLPDGDASRWEQLYDELLNACRFYWNRSDKIDTPKELMKCMLQSISLKARREELKREEQILLAEYGLSHQDRSVAAGKALPDESLIRQVLDQTIALGNSQGLGRLRARLAMSLILKGDYNGASDITNQMSDLKTMEDMRIQMLVNLVALSLQIRQPPEESRLAQAQAWLQTPAAAKEPIVSLYLEAASAVLDSRKEGSEGLDAALHGLKLLKPLMESLEKVLKYTALPEWAAVLCERVIVARTQDPNCLDDAQYLEALRTGSDAYGELYKREEDPQRKDAFLDRCVCINANISYLYRAAGENRRASSVGSGVLHQTLNLRKEPTAQSLKAAWDFYRVLCSWQDADGSTKTGAMDLIGKGEDILEGFFSLDHDPAWMELLLKETARYRTILPKTNYEGESWLREKLAESYNMDRKACMNVLNQQQSSIWQIRYLQIAEIQIGAVGEGNQNILENILGDLWTIIPETPEVENRLLDVLDKLTGILHSMPDDLMYLMFQAVRDLDSAASMPEVEAYIAKRREQMRAEGI